MNISLVWTALIVSAIISSIDWFFRKKLLENISYRTIYTYSMVCAGAVILLIGSIYAGFNMKTVKKETKKMKAWHWVALIGVPIIVSGAGWLVYRALSESPVSFFAPVRSLIVIILIGLSGFLLLKEKLSTLTCVGMALLVGALVIMIVQTCVYKKV